MKSRDSRAADRTVPVGASAPFHLSPFGRWMLISIAAGVAVWGLVIYVVLRMLN